MIDAAQPAASVAVVSETGRCSRRGGRTDGQ
jgi:hypothetical protein